LRASSAPARKRLLRAFSAPARKLAARFWRQWRPRHPEKNTCEGSGCSLPCCVVTTYVYMFAQVIRVCVLFPVLCVVFVFFIRMSGLKQVVSGLGFQPQSAHSITHVPEFHAGGMSQTRTQALCTGSHAGGMHVCHMDRAKGFGLQVRCVEHEKHVRSWFEQEASRDSNHARRFYRPFCRSVHDGLDQWTA